LFELTDARLCCPGPIVSVPALSLNRSSAAAHGSLYKALSRGRIDPEQMRDLLLAHRPVKWPAVFAVDASTWDRCDGRDLARAGPLLLGVQAFGRAADRGRLVLPVDHPARLGPAIPGPHRCTPHASRPPATPQRPPSTRSAGSSNACPTMGRCRCSSSTPATTPRLVTWRELVAATRRRAYADEPYWRRPATVRGQPQCRENRKCQDLVRICGPVSAEMLIGLGRGRREPFLNAARAGQPRRVSPPLWTLSAQDRASARGGTAVT